MVFYSLVHDAEFTVPDDVLRTAAVRIAARFPGSMRKYMPTFDELRRAFVAGFWASLTTEEGRQARFQLSVGRKWCVGRESIQLDPAPRLRELTAENLRRLFPVTTPGRSSIGIHSVGDRSEIWGIMDGSGLVSIDITGPGCLTVKCQARSPLNDGDETIAVISGQFADLIDASLYSEYLQLPRGDRPTDAYIGEAAVLRDIVSVAERMLRRGNGGTLLLTEDVDFRQWLDIPYLCSPPFIGLMKAREDSLQARAALHLPEPELSARGKKLWEAAMWETRRVADDESAVNGCRETLAAVTDVDGAAVLSWDLRLLGFGAKIIIGKPPQSIQIRRPTERDTYQASTLAGLGGTRHQSAAQFVARTPGSRALVASHDRKLMILRPGTDSGSVLCLEHAEWLL